MNHTLLIGGHVSAIILFGLSTTAPLRGAVVFTDISDIPFFSVGEYLSAPIDFNADGISDLLMRNFGNELVAFSTSTSKVAGLPASPPNLNNFAAAFLTGNLIGSELSVSYEWNTGYSGLISSNDIGSLGLWGSKEAYLGVEFDISGHTHYGWILIDTPFDFGGGIIKSFAYESEIGTAIIAGSVPEPSTFAYIGIGILLVWARQTKTRTNRTTKAGRTRRWR